MWGVSADPMHHVKSEHHLEKDCMDDDEDIDDDDDRKPGDLLMVGSHHHHHHHLHHHPHPHSMLGGGGLKEEMGKNGSPSDCGVPIPATKPKIWSLADTAACKTPPPPPSSQQQQQQQQQPWLMPSTGCGNMSMNMTMNSFALPSAAMSPSAAAAAPYSRYGGLLSGPYGGGGGNGVAACSASVGASGFPEVQTDTPPQTPPNMKLPSVAGNLLGGPVSCFGGGAGAGPGAQSSTSATATATTTGYGAGPGHHNFLGNFGRLQQSPQKERPSGKDAAYQHHSHMMSAGNSNQGTNEGTAFKPFYKRWVKSFTPAVSSFTETS